MNGWKRSRYRLIGVCPIIFHNGQLANPLNNFSKEIKKISSKKKKTDADYERMAELEFKGSLYVNKDNHPIVPIEGIEAVLVAGAKKAKEGKDARAGVYCMSNAILKYDGPTDPDALWNNNKFRMVAGIRNPSSGSRIMRTRPMFDNWSCDIELCYNPEVVNEEQIFNWLRVAGDQCGAFDWRPKFGRFIVERLDKKTIKEDDLVV